MNNCIYKYPFSLTDMQIVRMPKTALVRHVGLDPNGEPCLWAEVDPTEAEANIVIEVRGTGRMVPEDATFLGSLVSGPFVWHVWLRGLMGRLTQLR